MRIQLDHFSQQLEPLVCVLSFCFNLEQVYREVALQLPVVYEIADNCSYIFVIVKHSTFDPLYWQFTLSKLKGKSRLKQR